MHNKITLFSKVIQKHNLTLAWHSVCAEYNALYCVIYIGGKKSRVICTLAQQGWDGYLPC